MQNGINTYKAGFINAPVPFIKFIYMNDVRQRDIIPYAIYDVAVRRARKGDVKVDGDAVARLLDMFFESEGRLHLCKFLTDRLVAMKEAGVIRFSNLAEKINAGKCVLQESERDDTFKSYLTEFEALSYAIERCDPLSQDIYIQDDMREVYKRYACFRRIDPETQRPFPPFSCKMENLKDYITLKKEKARKLAVALLSIRSIVGKSTVVLTTKNMIRARMIGAQSTSGRHIREAIGGDPVLQQLYDELTDKVLHTILHNLQKYYGVMEEPWQNKGIWLSTSIRKRDKFIQEINNKKNESATNNV